jgi:hypothetical protein
VECAIAGATIPGEYTCLDSACDLKSLCAAHALVHRQWGHDVKGLVPPPDHDWMPSPDTLLGVIHCPNPEHCGPEGSLVLWCKSCEELCCRRCGDDHLRKEHTVWPLDKAAVHLAAVTSKTLPVLHAGVAHQTSRCVQLRAALEGLASNRAKATAALTAKTGRLHEELDKQHAAALSRLDEVYERKVAALEAALKDARCSVAELETVMSAGDTALQSSTSDTRLVHVQTSVEASLPLANARPVDELDMYLTTRHPFKLPADSVGLVAASPKVSRAFLSQLPTRSAHQPQLIRSHMFMNSIHGLAD